MFLPRTGPVSNENVCSYWISLIEKHTNRIFDEARILASHTLLTLCANRVPGGIAFIQRNPSFLIENGEVEHEVRLWSLTPKFRAIN